MPLAEANQSIVLVIHSPKLINIYPGHPLTMPLAEANQSIVPVSSTVKTCSLQAAQFDSENWFASGAIISAANATSLQPTRFQ